MTGFRLPTNVKPLAYDLTLHPDLQTGLFTGKVIATVDIIEETPEIRIHSNGLHIRNVVVPQIETDSQENKKFELIIITRKDKSNFKIGSQTVTIEYDGDMKNRIVGLYSSSYTDENGDKRAIATTKFEPTYARQAFPCFDEPNMKAKYTVHLMKPKDNNYIALSNMPIKNEQSMGNGIMVNFEESVKMSTYLSCFIVCDFISETATINSPLRPEGIKLQVFATPAQVEKTKFALGVAKDVIEYFIDYFDIDYPLPKLDLIAIPDFVSGAMEHWGLVTFRETALLYDPAISSTVNQQRVAAVIAHELAHSWFGNLVTMDWWNDLWLNEGFASYIEYKGVHSKFKDWQMLDQFLIDDLHSILSTDATPASHPIVQTVLTPNEITEVFDTITYNKGASILRMLEDVVGEEVFRKGVTKYLKAKQWGNAVTQDLWDELQSLVSDGVNITEFMSTWTVQMGYPILTVKEEGDDLILTQKRFLKDYSKPGNTPSSYNYKWTVPVTYITISKDSTNIRREWFKYDQPSLKIKKPEGFIKFNPNQVGYYRINYSPSQWQMLKDAIKTLSTSDKTHLLEESFSIAESGDISYDIPLDLTKYLKEETNYIPWSVASSALSNIKKYLSDSLLYPDYVNYILSLVTPAYDVLTWDDKPTDTHLIKRARIVILKAACSNGHVKCLEEATTRFKNWLQDSTKNPIKSDIRSIVFYYGMANSGKDEWFKLLDLFKKEIDATEKMNMLDALSAVKETWLLKQLIELGKKGNEQIVRDQDYFSMLQYIAGNLIGEPIVWDYVRENWDELVERFTLNDRYLGRLIPSITRRFITKTKLVEMEAFFEKYPDAGAGKSAREEALANVNNNIKWIEKNKKPVEDWIKKLTPTPSYSID